MRFFKKGGLEIEGLLSIVLWVAFLILAGGVVYFLIKRLTE